MVVRAWAEIRFRHACGGLAFGTDELSPITVRLATIVDAFLSESKLGFMSTE